MIDLALGNKVLSKINYNLVLKEKEIQVCQNLVKSFAKKTKSHRGLVFKCKTFLISEKNVLLTQRCVLIWCFFSPLFVKF